MRRLLAPAVTAAALAAPATALAAPGTGDWEADGVHGAVGSFAVARSHGHRVVEDLVVQAPISCQNAFSTPLPIDVEVIGGAFRLGGRGAFHAGSLKRGGSGTLVSAKFRAGRFTITYRHVSRTRNLYEGGAQVCDTGAIKLTARPGHRSALHDGLWEGQSAEQQPVELDVVAGGRALKSPLGAGPTGTKEYAFGLAGSSSSDFCAYQMNYQVFIPAGGSFSNAATRLGDEAVVNGKFTGTQSASGSFSNLAEGCSQESWSASWRLAAG